MTRRELLTRTGGFLAASALPARFGLAAADPISGVMIRLSTFMSGAADRALPDEVIEKTKHHILDTFAAMISGSELAPGKVGIKLARLHARDKVATVAGCDVVCGPIEAAMANGMLAHSDETDDSHAPSHSHPGCSVIPAAMAVGEKFGISGSQFLRAVALGYDVGSRVGITLGGANYQIKTHRATHSVAGDFGAAAAAA